MEGVYANDLPLYSERAGRSSYFPWTETRAYFTCDASFATLWVRMEFLFKKHLEEDEQLVKVVHKHWFIGIKTLFWPTVFVLAVLSLPFFSHSNAMLLISAIAGITVLVWWLRNFFDYFLDAWILTDQGIIDIAWFGWFHRQSTRVLYSDLQGVSYEINGVWGTLFNFGTVSVEKISTGAVISLEFVKNPKQVELLTLKNMEGYLHKKNLKDSSQVQKLLATILAEQLNKKDMFPSDDEDDE